MSIDILTSFPDRDACFGSTSNLSSVCQVPTPTMINFLNMTDVADYLNAYCNNPPEDSCAFGYCPNGDVASPAVRYSAYFTSVVSAILVLYSPEDVTSSFFAQLLNVYSQVVAAIVAIAGHNLTRVHSVIALALAASPLSLYLIFYVLRSMLGRMTRLDSVFGQGKYLNRALVLVALPLWIAVLVFTSLPNESWHFQQEACDSIVANNRVTHVFFVPFILLLTLPGFGEVLIGSLVIPWAIAVFRTRKVIWAKGDKWFPIGRLWRKVVERYPFIQFYTVVVAPAFFWIINIEIGIMAVDPREQFSPTYGQLLAIFVTVPPFFQLCALLPRVPRWFMDLSWVRLVTCRRDKPYYLPRPNLNASRSGSRFSTLSGDLPMEQRDSDKVNLLSEGEKGGQDLEEGLPTLHKDDGRV
uniref:Uncharacterized protein n=1 Tax=Mycena chlorophos TaxID=658473 RepID=A0ABQ0MB40_MYCCL|nr:predicted protein [Mycena chlorophos]